MKRLVALTAAYLASYSSFAYASNTGTSYFELALSGYQNKVDISDNAVELDTGMADLVLGYQFSDYLSLEAHAGFGLNEDSASVMGKKVTGNLKNLVGANLKASIPVYNTVMLVAKAGYYQADMNYSVAIDNIDKTVTMEGATYGAGVEYYLDYSSYLGLSYQSYKGDLDASAVTLTFGTRF